MAQIPVPNDGTKYYRADGSEAVGQVVEGGPFGEMGVYTDSQGKQVWKNEPPKPAGVSVDLTPVLERLDNIELKVGGLTLAINRLTKAITG